MLRCSGPADFLAALPQLVGFTSRDSVFVVLFEGSRAESAMRFDLPSGEAPRDTAALLDLICGTLAKVGELGASPGIVIHCERSFAEAGGPPWRRFATRLRNRLRRNGIRPRELCCVAPDGWGAYSDPDLPSGGRPLREIEQSRVALEARWRGVQVPELSEIGAIPTAPPELIAAAEQALADMEQEPAGIEREPSGQEQECTETGWEPAGQDRVAVTAQLAESALRAGPSDLPPKLCARLSLAAAEPDRWLVLALTLLTDADFVVELARSPGIRRFTDIPLDREGSEPRSGSGALVSPPNPHDRPSAPLSRTPPPQGEGAGGFSPTADGSGSSMREILTAVASDRADRERLRRAAETVEAAIAPVPDRLRPGLLALAGWARWMTGMGSVAGRHIDTALRIDPAHELARMTGRLVAAGTAGTAGVGTGTGTGVEAGAVRTSGTIGPLPTDRGRVTRV